MPAPTHRPAPDRSNTPAATVNKAAVARARKNHLTATVPVELCRVAPSLFHVKAPALTPSIDSNLVPPPALSDAQLDVNATLQRRVQALEGERDEALGRCNAAVQLQQQTETLLGVVADGLHDSQLSCLLRTLHESLRRRQLLQHPLRDELERAVAE